MENKTHRFISTKYELYSMEYGNEVLIEKTEEKSSANILYRVRNGTTPIRRNCNKNTSRRGFLIRFSQRRSLWRL